MSPLEQRFSQGSQTLPIAQAICYSQLPESPIHEQSGKDDPKKIFVAPHRFNGPRCKSGFHVARVEALSFVQHTGFLFSWLDRLHGCQHRADCSRAVHTQSIAMGATSAGAPFVLLRHRTAHRLLNMADYVRVKKERRFA
jgi:hypothetical protein